MKSLIWTFVLLLICVPAWAAKPPAITTTSCPQGQTTVVYGVCSIYGKWGTKPYTFSIVTGSLPTGLSLATVSNVGKITGTPTVVGTFGFKIRLTDSAGTPKTYDQSLYIDIIATPVPPANPVQITTTSLPTGLISTAYSTTVVAQNGTLAYTWSIPFGSLPNGLSLNSSTGQITGTPLITGTYPVTIRVTDSSTPASTAQQNYYIVIGAAPTGDCSPTDESGCGNVGDAYEGSPAPPAQTNIAACNTNITTPGNYVLTGNIGADASVLCLQTVYPSGSVNIDLGGFTVTGLVRIQSGYSGNVVFNGIVNCNSSGGSCVVFGGKGGRIHHLTTTNASLTPLANIRITATATSIPVSPLVRVDHITSTVGAAPNVTRTRNIMSSEGNGTTSWGSIEADHNFITCSDNASACQGVELYAAPTSSVHNNKIVLPAICSLCTDTARGILFDQRSSGGSAYSNKITVRGNRAFRVRNSMNTRIYSNSLLGITTPGRHAAIQLGETNYGIDYENTLIHTNIFQLDTAGNGVVSAEASGITVRNNTVSCIPVLCAGVGFFAQTQVVDTSVGQTGTEIILLDNDVSALTAGSKPALMVCGPPGVSAYKCAGSSTGTTEGTICNSGTAVGNGTIISLASPCQ